MMLSATTRVTSVPALHDASSDLPRAAPAQIRSEEPVGTQVAAGSSSIGPSPVASGLALPAPSGPRARLAERARTAKENLDVALYNGLVARHILGAYGSDGAYAYRDRLRATYAMARALDAQGLTVFTHDLNTLLAEPNVQAFLHDVRAATPTPEHPLKLWELALAHAGSRDEAIRWIAVVLQDYSPRATDGHGCLAAVTDATAREGLRGALLAVADAENRGALAAYPDGVDCAGARFYHYYVPAYLAQRLVAKGVSPDLAFLTASTFNLEYEIAQPALLAYRHKQTIGALTPLIAAASGRSLTAEVQRLRAAGTVDDTFNVGDLDLVHDLHMSEAQIAAILSRVDRDNGLVPEAKAQLAASHELTMNLIAETVNASYMRTLALDTAHGAWLTLARHILESRDFIGDFVANGTRNAVPLAPQDAQGAYAGFAGAALVLPEAEPPLPREQLMRKLLADPTDTMRELFAPRLASPPVSDSVYAQLANRLGRESGRARVAVIDTEFNSDVPRGGRDFIDADDDPTSRSFHTLHGTPLVKLVQRGTTAIAAIPLRADLGHIIAAIDYAAEQGASCVVISQDMTAASAEGQQIFRQALRRHPEMVVVLASGNEGTPVAAQPYAIASIDEPNLVVVAAATATRRVSPLSSYGAREVRFAMRGGSLERDLWQDSRFSLASNIGRRLLTPDAELTSHAAPAMGNLIAKVRLLAPELSLHDALAVITATAHSDAASRARVRDGIPDNDRAERLAAVLACIQAGVTPQTAVAKLGLTGENAASALADYARFTGS